MKKTILTVVISSLAFGAYAEEATTKNTELAQSDSVEDINYGDPTASFSTLGLSRSGDATQINGMLGFGANIFQLDVGVADKKTVDDKIAYNYRARYFHVTDGLGFSVDVLGDRDSTTALAGMIYKFEITDNFLLFPMLSIGRTHVDEKNTHAVTDKQDSNIYQAGLYGMYAFDARHWLYANPKSTYVQRASEWLTQIEVGGGYMVTDSVSVGFKVEHTAESDISRKDTTGWVQANYYF
ncbi:hypothetical protein [Vibrio methylphosphonaticus]|uniref:hypothetical protein n=1 Tax=Vibrio methylphosphonaticus TaxID=2946866 RepID=UPI002029C273|nr:hypothetical protein [Vibrio methylphosphonaticus]MCL9774146.1 hypothetical protein [Vibrio methylphosphonaticus]